MRDPRILQIAFLGSFLCAGLTVLQFDLPLWQPVLITASAVLTQWGMTRLLKVPPAGYLSPLISSLGLSLLLRSDVWWIPPFAAAVAGLAFYLQHGLWKYNALIWALLLVSPLVPLIDWLFRGERYRWPGVAPAVSL